MKILFITERFGDKIPTGVISRRIANELHTLGNNIAIISSERIGEKWAHGPHIICSTRTIIPGRILLHISNILGINLSSYKWRKKVYNESLKLINSFNPDVIYARSTPISVCQIAAKLHVKTGIKVMMHFTDPVPAPKEWDPNLSYRKRMISTMDKILPYASSISFGNQAMLKYQQSIQKYHFEFKSFISPDPGPSSSSYFKKQEKRETILLVYLGSLYGNRNPKPLFLALDQLNKKGYKCELKIYDINRSNTQLPDFARFFGRTDEVKTALLDADILINLDGDDKIPVFISSKLKEYLYCGRPIISITPANSPSRSLTNKLQTVKSVENNCDEISSAIEFFTKNIFGESDYFERYEIIKTFTPSNVTKQINEELKKLIK